MTWKINYPSSTLNGGINGIYVCNFYWLPVGLQVFLKGFYIHYTFIGATFINRCQPVPVWFSGPEIVTPHLESALDKQL